MGIATLALVSAGLLSEVVVPWWVIVGAATAMSLGTAVGGWRIMRTMGNKIVDLEPIQGFAAQTTAGAVLLATAHLGMPVSTTQVISGAIMGVGSSKGPRHVRWGVARNILVAWVVTIPASALVGALAWVTLETVGIR
jgi:PiT family inorganic phosphate transporter